MKKIKLIFLLAGLLSMWQVRAQTQFTPNGILDTIYDNYGNKKLLSDIMFSTETGALYSTPSAPTLSATCGYFNVYYATGSGMEILADPAHIRRRNVICQLLTDISAFINSPLTSTLKKVNILVDDITPYGAAGAAGIASGYYAHATVPATGQPGIADNEIWKTIHSGKDSYTNVAPPVSLSINGFFHGFMAFDFVTINWNDLMNTPASASQIDLYSVALHELTHALGFASLINSTGVSKFGVTNNYYSRYDLFLKDNIGNSLLTNTGACSPIYGQTFNAAISTTVLAPTVASCPNDVVFAGSVNQKCFTPSAYTTGSSLSHFEDICHSPIPYASGTYYVMNSGIVAGITRRFLKQEERMALCDLGYKTNLSYGNLADYTYTTYVGSCAGIEVAGINDGLSGGSYLYTSFTPTLTIPLASVLSNDYAAAANLPLSLSCIQSVYAVGTVSIVGASIVFTATPGYAGPVLLRYVPKDNAGTSGNITYIYGFIYPSGCSPVNACDLVQNNGFESSFGAGACGNIGSGVYINCWYPYSWSPDIFTRGCTTTANFNLGTSTASSTPVWDSHNGSPNNRVFGCYEGSLLGTTYNESVQNFLGATLVNGTVYTLKYWAYNYKGNFTQFGTTFVTNTLSSPCVISVCSASTISTATSFPSASVFTILSNTLSATTNTWLPISTTFTYTGPTGYNTLVIGLDYLQNLAAGYSTPHPSATNFYVLLDDISLVPTALTPTLSIPVSTVCTTSSLLNLGTYASPPGGVFAGPGVTYTGGNYNFNSPPTLPVGTYSVSYTYSTALGCFYTTTTNIVVASPAATPTIIITPTLPATLCAGQSVTLTATGAVNYTWQPVGVVSNSVVVTPASTTIYTVTGQNICGVLATKTISIVLYPTLPAISLPSSQTICVGSTATITAGGAISYTWQPSGFVGNPVTVMPTSSTIYTCSGTDVCGSVGSNTISVTVKPLPTITITSTLSSLCSAASSGSTTVLSYTTSSSGTSATWIATNAISGATLSVPITGGVSTATVNLSSYINYTASINIIATYTSSGGCIGTQTITLYACCTPTAGVTKYTNTTFATTTSFSTPVILSGTINVTFGLLSFVGTNVFVDPGTKILLKGTSSLSLKSSYMHGCTAMWDGIAAVGTTSNTIQITGSRVEDARRAVIDSLGKANLIITNSYFNKNQVGVYIKGTKPSTATFAITGNLFTCSTITAPTSPPWYTVTPSLTNSTTIGAFPLTTMLPPLNMYNAFCGILLQGAVQAGVTNSVITIGSNVTNANVFDKVKTGIYCGYSSISAQNNLFQNCTSSLVNPNFTLGVGVLIGNGTITNYYNNIGGSVANKNTFYNNEYGVYNFGKSTLNVTYNKFDNHFISVLVTSNNNNQIVNILNNNIYKSKVGISCYNNAPQIKATIKDNNIDNSTAIVGAYNSNYAIYCGESVAPTSAANTTSYTVSNNNIKNYYNGIWSAQTLSTTINDNEVHMAQDNTTDHWQRGIRVENSNTPKVNNNIVDIPSLNQWGYWQLGIDMGSNQVPRVQCNSVTNVCMGLTFSGANITTPGDGILGNYLQNNAYGFWILNNGEIGSQFKTVGTTTLSADNAWAGYTLAPPSAYYTYAQGSSNWLLSGTSKLYTRSSGIYNLPGALVYNDLYSFPYYGTNTNTASSGTCNVATPTPTNVRLGASATAKARQNSEEDADDYNLNGPNMGRSASVNLAEADDISNNTISKRAINHYQLYRSVKLQGIDVTGSPAMRGFMNSAKTDNVGLFFAVDSLLHNAETDSMYIPSARYLNNSITVKNKVDKTHKAFNELYASYLAQHNNLKANEIGSLEDIAYLCPAIYGNAVYQARAILFGIKRQSYMSDCEKVAPAKSSKKIANSFGDKAEVVVYPNPANSELFINAIGYNEVTIKLYNIMGALVLEKVIAPNQSLNISNLVNGIYTYKIYSSNNELKTDKLIIIK